MSAPTVPSLLDTAVPMYAAGTPHPYRDACQWVMSQIAGGGMQVVLDIEVIQEILHRYGALGRFPGAVQMARDLMTLEPAILSVSAADMQTAVTLFERYAPQGVRARDCIHAAVMHTHGLTHIISSDTHFALITGLTRLDPIVLYQTASQSTP